MLSEDRTAIETDWQCGQKRFWLTEWRAPGDAEAPVGGLVPVDEVWNLEFGKAFADGIAAITNEGISAQEAIEMVSVGMEAKWGINSLHLLQGLLYGASIYVLPRLRNDYDILGVEKEQYYTYVNQYMLPSRPDIILRRKDDKTVWVPDWKTTSWKDIKWLLKWQYAIQLHLQAAAVQQSMPPDANVQGSLILGAYKGYEDERTGERISPFTYIYRGSANGKPNFVPKWVRGWDRLPVSEYPGGIFAWVEHLKREWPMSLAEQFPISQPILLRMDMVETIAAERLNRLIGINTWREGGRLLPAPHRFDHRTIHCDGCGYKTACWSPQVGRDPLASGLYVPRVPNHEVERAALQFYRTFKQQP